MADEVGAIEVRGGLEALFGIEFFTTSGPNQSFARNAFFRWQGAPRAFDRDLFRFAPHPPRFRCHTVATACFRLWLGSLEAQWIGGARP
jgi:hypothetical protein